MSAAQGVQDAIAAAVLVEDHHNGIPWSYSEQEWAWGELGGISSYLPLMQDDWRRRYYKAPHLQIGQDGQWDDFISAYWNHSEPPPDPECPPEGCDLPPGPLPMPGEVILAVGPLTITASVDEVFEVDIILQADIQPVDGATAAINFDPTVMQVASITPGSALPVQIQNSFDNTNGQLDLAVGAFTDFPTGTITVATITFTATAQTDGSPLTFNMTPPRLSDVTFGGHSVLDETIGNTVVIHNITLACYVTPSPTHAGWDTPLYVSLTIPGEDVPIYSDMLMIDDNGLPQHQRHRTG